MEATVKKHLCRSPNPFFLFSSENRRKLIEENPGLANKDITQLLGSLWRELESNKKQVFVRKAQEFREQYLKQFPGYKFNPWTVKRLRERQIKRQSFSFDKDISDSSPKIQTDIPSVRPEVEPISEEKRNFFRCLGLCQRNSTEYFNIEAKLALNARKYHIFTFIQTVRVNNKANRKTKIGEGQNIVKRARGRPRKYWPNTTLPKNRVNKV